MTDPTEVSSASTAHPDRPDDGEPPPQDGATTDVPEAADTGEPPEAVEAGDAAEVVEAGGAVDVVEAVEAGPGDQPEQPPAEPAPVTDVEVEAPSAEPVEPEPVEPEPVEPEPVEPVVELPTGSGADIEWQPVYSGDQIEWQPVVSSEGDGSWEATDAPAGAWEEGETATPDYGGESPDYEAAAGADWGVPEPDEIDDPDDAGYGALVEPDKSRPDARAKQRRTVIVLSVLTAVVVLTGIVGFVLSNGITSQTSGGPDPTVTPTTGPQTPATLPEGLFETFVDTELTGLSVKYPRAWVRSGSPVADVRLTASGEGRQLLRIRVLPIEVPATPENINNYKTVTDGIVGSDPNNRVLQHRLIQLNGRLAYYYLYTYNDAPTGQEGVHAHYFIFEGKRMFTMVLQAAPVQEFQRLAGVYDQIAESFTVPEERFAPSASTTTTPTTPTTTTPPSTTP